MSVQRTQRCPSLPLPHRSIVLLRSYCFPTAEPEFEYLRQGSPDLYFKYHRDFKKHYNWNHTKDILLFGKYFGSMVILTLFYGFKSITGGGASRWWKSKTWRSPSSPQIHQKYVYMRNNSYRTPSERWQKTSDLPKGKKLPM